MDNEVLEDEEQNTVTGSGGSMMEEEDLPEVEDEVPESGSTEEPKEELPEEDQDEDKEETKKEIKAVDPLGTENLAANAQIYSTLALQDMNIGDNTKKEKKE